MKLERAVLLMATVILFAMQSFAEVYTDGLGHDWTYESDGTSVRITAVTESGTMTAVSGEIAIPSQIEGLTVTAFGQTFLNNTGITSVTIPSGVTVIEASAFYECTALASVSLPSGLTAIDAYAFYRCGKLATIDMPDSVEYIGKRSFYYCQQLKNVRIPKKVTAIYEYTFCGCKNLTSIDFPSTLTFIGKGAFDASYLESLTLPEGLKTLGEYAFADCRGFTELHIPGSLEEIPTSAFINQAVNVEMTLTHLTIGEGVKVINGFSGNTKLVSVVIPSSVERIASGTFTRCHLETVDFRSSTLMHFATIFGNAQLREIIISDDNPAYSCIDGVLYDKDVTTLLCCPGAAKTGSFTVPSSVKKIADRAFGFCKGLESIVLPQNLETICDSAFNVCSSLTSIDIPATVTSMGTGLLFGCTNLESVNIEEGNMSFYSEDGIVYDSENNLVICPPGRSTHVRVSDTAAKINDGAFSSCARLPSVYIPSNVKEIGMTAFIGCSALSSVTIEPGITEIKQQVFSSCSSLTEITIPQGVTSIGYYAFQDCASLESINFPDSLTSLGASVFDNCKSLRHVTFPNGFKKMGNSIFVSCAALESVDLPPTLENIGMNSFVGCNSLKTIVIPDSVTTLTQQCFMDCGGLETIIIGDGVTKLPAYAFVRCKNLKNVVFGKNVESIGLQSFSTDSPYLTEIVIPDSVKTIGNSAFTSYGGLYNNYLQRVQLGNGVTSIGQNAFNDCIALKEVLFGENVKTIGYGAFRGCTNLPYVALPEGLQQIGDLAFDQCTKLSRVIVPSSVYWIGASAFSYTDALKEIVFSGNAPTSVGDSAFVGTAANCKGYVSRASTGWNVDIPGSWNAITLDYFDKYVTVSLDVNGGDALPTPERLLYVEYGSALGALSEPVRDGYRFLGWFTDRDGGDKVEEDMAVTKDVTLYAHWKEVVQFTWTNANTSNPIWDDEDNVNNVINECNFDFIVHPQEGLPEGAKVRIKKITLANLDGDFDDFDSATNKSDPYYLRINGVNSDKYELGGDIKIASNNETEDNTLVYRFSNPCVVIVGKRYTAISGNNTGEKGNGLAFLYKNGKLVYGSNADRASVRYVKSGDEVSMITTMTAQSRTGEVGWHPVYEIEAELVDDETSVFDAKSFDWRVTGSESTIEPISKGWFGDATAFSGGMLGNTSLRVAPDSSYGYARHTASNTYPYRGIGAMNDAFSFALYADVSAVPATGKALLMEFGNSGSKMALLYREGDNVYLAFGDKTGPSGAVASVEMKLGWHLYAVTCDPTTGKVALSLDGGDFSYGSYGGSITLGTGFQIGSIYGGMSGSGLVQAPDMAMIRLLGFYGELAPMEVKELAGVFPANENPVCEAYPDELASKTLTVLAGQTVRVHVGTEQERAGYAASNVNVKDGGSLMFVAADGSEISSDMVDVTTSDGVSSYTLKPYEMPALPATATPAEVASEIAGFADKTLGDLIDTPEQYNDYRAWVKIVEGGVTAAKSSSYAADSYVLGATELFRRKPKIDIGALRITEGPDNPSENGTVTLSVTVKDGDDPVKVAEERVAEMFEATSDLGDWAGEAKLAPTVEILESDGATMLFKVKPGDGKSSSAFLRIRR